MERILPRCALAVLTATLFCCSGPEEKLVNRFLEATREKDLATLAETSMVRFPGMIHSWHIEAVKARRQETFVATALQKELDKMRRVRVDHHQALRQFRRKHKSALAELQSQIDGEPNLVVKEEDQELFSTWEKMEKADRESKSRLDSAREEVELEREGARKSLNTWTPIDEFDGDVMVREVLVAVDPGDGKELPYVLTLKQYTLEHKKDNTRPDARWILMVIQQQEEPSG